MAFTEQDVHDALKKHGVTNLNELAKKISEESKATDKSGSAHADYLWSGRTTAFGILEKVT